MARRQTPRPPTRNTGSVTVVGEGRCGGKGDKTWAMAHQLQGYDIAKIPPTVILAGDVTATEVTGLTDTAEFLRAIKLRSMLRQRYLAVRSSAFCEDGGCSCPGIFDTHFVENDRDLLQVAAAVETVSRGYAKCGAASYVARRNLEQGMGIIIQGVAGGRLSDEFFGPLFSGVLDTSHVNGKENVTLSVVLGLGTVAVANKRSANLITAKRGNLAARNADIAYNQTEAHVIDADGGFIKTISIQDMLKMAGFRTIRQALGDFMKRYRTPLYVLSLELEKLFGHGSLDIEFAVTPTKGKKLYALQARTSHMARITNANYPANINEEDILALSRLVLGSVNVKTETVANYSSRDYKADAEAGFPSLKKLDAMGKPYILMVPPEATSSVKENIPIAELNNLVFVVERLTSDEIHVPGATGVDHASRLMHETGIGYMEAVVNFERLRAGASEDRSIPNIAVYNGEFEAAVCGGSERGVFYFSRP